MMSTLYLRASLSERDIAIPAAKVESVVNVTDRVAVPNVAPYVAGLFAMRSRVLTLIDCQWFITGCRQIPKYPAKAVVVDIDGHNYALLIDAVRDIFDWSEAPKLLPAGLGDGWELLGDTILDLEDEALLVVKPENIVRTRREIAA